VAGADQMNIRMILVLSILWLTSLSMQVTMAQPPVRLFPVMGEIASITNQSITVMDNKIRISPTVKVKSADGKATSFDKLKPGMKVGLQLTRFNNLRYVDTIHILK
jgi:hypothetical protein